QRLIERLRRRPDEKDERDRDLGGQEDVGQDAVREDRPLLHRPAYLLARSNWRNRSLPRRTAASSASLAGVLPAHTASSSSSITSRIWAKFPRRKPLEFSVGALLVIWRIETSAPGFFSWHPCCFVGWYAARVNGR